MLRFKALPNRWIKVTAPVWAVLQENSAFLTKCVAMGLEIWRINLKLLKSTAETIGAKLFVAKQATLIVPGLPESECDRCKYGNHGFDHNAHIQAYEGIYRVIEQEISPDSIIDVTKISGQSESFHDHVYPTKKGTTQIAEIMSDFLLPHIGSE